MNVSKSQRNILSLFQPNRIFIWMEKENWTWKQKTLKSLDFVLPYARQNKTKNVNQTK